VGKVGIESELYGHLAPGDRCDGVLGDIVEFRPGWTVVTDTADRQLGQGDIGPGFIEESGLCAWSFAVTDVPEVRDGYRIGMAVFTDDKYEFVSLEEMRDRLERRHDQLAVPRIERRGRATRDARGAIARPIDRMEQLDELADHLVAAA